MYHAVLAKKILDHIPMISQRSPAKLSRPCSRGTVYVVDTVLDSSAGFASENSWLLTTANINTGSFSLLIWINPKIIEHAGVIWKLCFKGKLCFWPLNLFNLFQLLAFKCFP